MTAADLCLATDPRIHDVLGIDDATKVRTADRAIVKIGKQLTDYDRIDYYGVFCVTPRLLEKLAIVRAQTGDCSLTKGGACLPASAARGSLISASSRGRTSIIIMRARLSTLVDTLCRLSECHR